MAEPDYSPIVFRRIAALSDRMDMLYTALHLALVVVFVGVMVALYTLRKDLIGEINK